MLATPSSQDNSETSLGINLAAASIEQISHPLLTQHRVVLMVKREDRLHPIISGNKWRKLKYILKDSADKQSRCLVSMGGAWSNHLHALAWCAKQLGYHSKAYIRGQAPRVESPTLRDMRAWGMQLEFVCREDFRQLRQQTADRPPKTLSPGDYWIPEGGASPLALKGIAELLSEIDVDYDVITAACGTATTLAGLIPGLAADKQALGFPVFKGGGYLRAEVEAMLPVRLPVAARWQLNTDYHFGGFAKQSPALETFAADFEAQTGIPLDPVYTSKLFFGLFDLIRNNAFPAGTRLLALHTGGLQGRRRITSDSD